MPQSPPMTVEEYLRTSFRPDCDYVDGEIQARNSGERDHSTVLGALCFALHAHRSKWNIVVLPAQRIQVSPTRFRVPDVCVLRREDPREQIVRRPPLICVEVLSRDDSLSSLQARVDDYVAIGVEHIWVVDPSSRRAYTAGPTGFLEVRTGELTVPGTPIRLSLDDLFGELDG